MEKGKRKMSLDRGNVSGAGDVSQEEDRKINLLNMQDDKVTCLLSFYFSHNKTVAGWSIYVSPGLLGRGRRR